VPIDSEPRARRVVESAPSAIPEGGAEVERAPVALLVGPDRDVQARLGSWLETDGFEVLVCPGPSAPDFVCVGVRTAGCPLAAGCDVVILDLWLDSDRELRGVSSRRLLEHYGRAGHPVLALAHRGNADLLVDGVLPYRVAFVDAPLDRREVVETARALIRPGWS
jgi:DNA-binding response OmpR family regulator